MQHTSTKGARTLRRPRSSYVSLVLSVLASATLLGAALASDILWVRVFLLLVAVVPIVSDFLLERFTWRAEQVRALRAEMSAKDMLPDIHESASSVRARSYQMSAARAKALGLSSPEQLQ